MKKMYLSTRSYRPVKMILAVISILLLNIFTWFNPQIVFTNGPKPANSLVFNVINYSDQAVYVDLLIRMNTSDKHYVEFNGSIGESYDIKRESEIVTYNKDGYLSYSFHFKNASSELALEKDRINVFANDYDDFNYIYDNCRYFKVVILDNNGSIIEMSKEYKLKGRTDAYLMNGVITYDVSQNRVEGIRNYQHFYDTLHVFFFYLLIAWLAPLLITVAVEAMIARKYKFKSIILIVCLNLVTNISLSFYIFKGQADGLNYVSAVITGEILVYVIELICLYMIYHKIISCKRIAQYTVVANTASLLITVLFNKVGKYVMERLL